MSSERSARSGSTAYIATLNVPAGVYPGLAGLTVHHAALVLDTVAPLLVTDATNAVALTLIP